MRPPPRRTEKCLNCGMPLLASDLRCPFCGKARSVREITRAQRANRVGASIALAVTGLPLAFVGTCSLLQIPSGGDYAAIPIVVAIAAFGLLAGIVIAFIAIWRQ